MAIVHWAHERDRVARRAQTAPFSRPDLGCWIAVLTGLDAHYGLARTFLSKTKPVVWEKHPEPAFDCSALKTGDYVQMHGFVSRSTQEDRFFIVVDNDDATLTLDEVDATDVLTHFRGEGNADDHA